MILKNDLVILLKDYHSISAIDGDQSSLRTGQVFRVTEVDNTWTKEITRLSDNKRFAWVVDGNGSIGDQQWLKKL